MISFALQVSYIWHLLMQVDSLQLGKRYKMVVRCRQVFILTDLLVKLFLTRCLFKYNSCVSPFAVNMKND